VPNVVRKAFIGLGSNKAWHGQSPKQIVEGAAGSLLSLGQDLKLSPFYDSPAWPDPKEPSYINAVASIDTVLSPFEILAGLQAIEAAFGRLRPAEKALRYAPRTLDLDLLAVGEEKAATQALELPHPRITERDFVLLPFHDIAPDWVHPVSGLPIDILLAALPEVMATRHEPPP